MKLKTKNQKSIRINKSKNQNDHGPADNFDSNSATDRPVAADVAPAPTDVLTDVDDVVFEFVALDVVVAISRFPPLNVVGSTTASFFDRFASLLPLALPPLLPLPSPTTPLPLKLVPVATEFAATISAKSASFKGASTECIEASMDASN
jgi:hypothetical protein